MLKSKFKYIIVLLLSISSIYSCMNKGKDSSLMKPIAISKSNDVVVIADNSLIKSEIGDTFKYFFESAYPITPNPEPLFHTRYFTYKEIDAQPLRRQLRSYIILVNLQDTASDVTKLFVKDIGKNRVQKILDSEGFNVIYAKDKWARDQLVIYIVGKNADDFIKAIKNNFSVITDKIHQHDESQIKAATYFQGENGILGVRAKKTLGIDIKIPKDYIQALFKEDEKLIWARRDSKKAISNFIVKAIEYKDTSQFSKKYIIKLINEFGKNVTSDTKGSRLVVNDKDLPVLISSTEINGNTALEARGIWEMTDDFMGGPFIAYLIKNKNTNDLAFVLGFVFAPGKDKKEYLQQMMTIANTLRFEKK